MPSKFPIVYFFSDFGANGPYTGQVEAVIRSNTQADFINLLADAPKTDPVLSSYLLAAIYQELPVKKGYMLAVVDPGVGSPRSILKITMGEMTIITPDNGLGSRLVLNHPDAEIKKLKNIPENISSSFHARDWFAPVVVNLIQGNEIEIEDIQFSEITGYDWPSEIPKIIYIDHYGNLVTGIKELPKDQKLSLAGSKGIEHAATFSSVPKGELFWYVNSMGLVEIAANSSSAAESLGVKIGDELQTI